MEELGINQAFLAAKKTAFDATKTRDKPDGDVLDPEYVKELANYTKIKNKAVRALHKTAKAEKDMTEHNVAIDALGLRAKTYSKLRKFDNMKEAKEALRAKYDDWQTAAYGMRGASPTDNFHGRVDGAGCFHIKSVDRKSKGLGVTYIYGADDNEEQPEFSDGEAPSDGEDGGGNEGASSRIRRAFTRMTTHARARPRIHAHGHAFTHTHACFMHSRAWPRIHAYSCIHVYAHAAAEKVAIDAMIGHQADKTYDEINLLGTSSEMRKFTEKLAKSRSLVAGKVNEYYAVFDISDPLDDSKAKKLYAMFQRHFNVA